MHRVERSLDSDVSAEKVWRVLRKFSAIDEFHPRVRFVDPLGGRSGEGARRRCNFFDGTSVVEEVIEWREGRGYKVRLSEIQGMPLRSAIGEIGVEVDGAGGCRVTMNMVYQVKYGPFGYLLGATAMRLMMRKVILQGLRGLVYRARTGTPVHNHVPRLPGTESPSAAARQPFTRGATS